MPDWPNNLPGFNANVEEDQQQGFIRTPTSIGPGKQRKRYSATSHFFTGTFLFTRAERAVFDTFYNTTLGSGALTFTMENPMTGVDATFRFANTPRFRLITGDGTATSMVEMKATLEMLP